MSVPRATTGGAVYNDLRNLARQQARPFDELLSLYALEGFLARLASSDRRNHMVLKGGVLLAAFDLRRPTRDVDLHAQGLSNDAHTVLAFVRTIAAIPFDDGLMFDTVTATSKVIREEDEYSGIRVSLSARLATAKVPLHVDINVGDPIHPPPREISLPRLLGQPVELRGYPMAMVHAEKIVSAVSRGTASTRWRDFGDIYSLAGLHAIDGDELLQSLNTVSRYRQVDLFPLMDVLDCYAPLAQSRYSAWRRQNRRDELPAQFQELLDRVFTFADPALAGVTSGRVWDPAALSWK